MALSIPQFVDSLKLSLLILLHIKASQSAFSSLYQVFTVGWIHSVPVWHQSILLSPEHDPNISGMISGGVEVRVVSYEKQTVHEWDGCFL